MNWQFTLYLLPVFLAGLLSASVALFAWWRRHTAHGLSAFVAMTLAVAIWSLGYTAEIAATDLASKIFWAKLEYPGIVVAPVAWLLFAARYTGRDKWLGRRVVAGLFGVPVITLLLVITNETHGFIWPTTRLDASGPFLALALSHGGWFWVHTVYSYMALLAGSLLLIMALARSPGAYRGQATLLLLGALTPWFGNALYLAGLNPVPQFDLTPLAFAVTGLLMALGLFRFQLLDLAPIAREAVIESMPDPMIVIDQANRIVDLNPAAEQIIGQSAAAVIGQSADRALAAWPALVECFQSVTEGHFEITLGAGADMRYYDLRLAPLTARRGFITGRLVVAHDITERKHAEAALRAFSADLEQRVADRTAELQQAQEALLASQKFAIVGTLASEVVHDVSNPLNTIIAASETLEALAEENSALSRETLQEYVPIISRAAWHATRIIQALRNYSRGSAPALTPCDLNNVAQEAILLMGSHLKQRADQKLVTELTPDLPRTICDHSQIAQVIINLVNNAWDALPPGGSVTLRTRRAATGNVLEVSDTGHGFAPEIREKIFRPFFTTKEEGQGTGLGLSIVSRIVRAHSGTIEVYSAGPGQGATFTVTLPTAPD